MADAAAAPAGAAPDLEGKDFAFFYEILTSFREAAASAEDGKIDTTKVVPFTKAMEMFLRIFAAFGNPFFADVVKKDVDGNIKKLRAAAEKHSALTLVSVLETEMAEPGMDKAIRKETTAGGKTGTVALLWMKRMMQFVVGLLRILCEDASKSLSEAAGESYGKTLTHCHNFVTRGVFKSGLWVLPARAGFYKNLAGETPVEKVEAALKEFVDVFEPQLKGIDAMFKARNLEPLIK